MVANFVKYVLNKLNWHNLNRIQINSFKRCFFEQIFYTIFLNLIFPCDFFICQYSQNLCWCCFSNGLISYLKIWKSKKYIVFDGVVVEKREFSFFLTLRDKLLDSILCQLFSSSLFTTAKSTKKCYFPHWN